jgi:hypothetical protein
MSEKELLQQSVFEIQKLRRHNEIMSARLEMFDALMLLFHTAPNFPSGGLSENIVWKINKHLESH